MHTSSKKPLPCPICGTAFEPMSKYNSTDKGWIHMEGEPECPLTVFQLAPEDVKRWNQRTTK